MDTISMEKNFEVETEELQTVKKWQCACICQILDPLMIAHHYIGLFVFLRKVLGVTLFLLLFCSFAFPCFAFFSLCFLFVFLLCCSLSYLAVVVLALVHST